MNNESRRSFTVEEHYQNPITGKRTKGRVPASKYRIVSLVDGRVLCKDFEEQNAEKAAGLYLSAWPNNSYRFIDGDDYEIDGLRDGHPASRFRVELVKW